MKFGIRNGRNRIRIQKPDYRNGFGKANDEMVASCLDWSLGPV
jgi:hypothetical protein